MERFLLGLLIAIVGVCLYFFLRKYKSRKWSDKENYYVDMYPYRNKAFIFLIAAVFGIVLLLSSFGATIDTGHTGVVTTFGKVEDFTYDSGFHITMPWYNIIEMDNRVQKSTVELACFSSDIQEVSCRYTLNYQISKTNAQDIYRSIGKDYFNTVITPNVAESVKTVTAHYTAESLVANRDSLAREIEELLSEQLKRFNIELVSTAIEDMDFTDEFTNAVEAKQVAVQNKLKATTEQEQKTMEEQQAAERQVIAAQAQAEVARIQAQADLEVQKINADAAEYTGIKESAKNEAIAKSLTDALIKYYYIQQWNGVLPETYMGADNVSTIVGID